MNWQEEVAKEMHRWGFRRGQYNPCLYSHAEWKVRVFLHGDDFASVGSREALRKFKTKMEQRFEIKTSVIGTGLGEVQEARVLNRIIRITDRGWEYEPDQRHAEMIVEQLGLEETQSVETPNRGGEEVGGRGRRERARSRQAKALPKHCSEMQLHCSRQTRLDVRGEVHL